MSTAGGFHKALETAKQFGIQTLQLFTKNANQWAGKPLNAEEVSRFRAGLRELNIVAPTAHDSYLINLASPDDALYQRSIEAFLIEVDRAEALGLSYLVMHPGAHITSGEEVGLAKVARALDFILAQRSECAVQVLLETTAGQGSTLGYRFEHLAAIITQMEHGARVGVCLDTCHIFAAGYRLTTAADYRATFAEFDAVIGMGRLKLFHVNDSLKPCGSRVDRHAGLGQGHIGPEAFRLLVNDSRFASLPMILETPKENDAGELMDPVNLARLRGWLELRRTG